MAQREIVQRVDDIDGSPAEHTVRFSLDGVHYEIDLSPDNAARLRSRLGDYVAAARRDRDRNVTRRRRPGTGARPAGADREQNQAIRAWARSRGWTISDRGRIPEPVLAAFHERAAG